MDPIIVITTLKLASLTTIILLFIGLPIAFLLSELKGMLKIILESLISLPLVLPPSVIGYYFLVTFSPKNPIGRFLEENFNFYLVFTFEGMLLASVIFSLPFMIQPIKSALENIPQSLKEASFTLGKSKLQTLWHVLIPNIKTTILAASVLTFAHALGEFGVILMMGGNIAGKTRVASVAIYDAVEGMNYSAANFYSAGLLAVSFFTLVLVYFTQAKKVNKK